MAQLQLFNIQHFAYQDGPGLRTVIFFQGCPLRCAWCHNPEGLTAKTRLRFSESLCTGCGRCVAVCPKEVHTFRDKAHLLYRENCVLCGACADNCPTGALETVGKGWTVEEILAEIRKDALFFGEDGGVTLSGGEPFAQPEGMLELLRALKQSGYNVCVETSGHVSEEHLIAAAPFIDRFLLDCKLTSEEEHVRWTGVGREKILRTMALLDELGASVTLRCPVIPDVNMNPVHFDRIALLAGEHPCVDRIELEPYHPLGISKAFSIGEESAYGNPEFLDRSLLLPFAEQIRSLCGKPVSVN